MVEIVNNPENQARFEETLKFLTPIGKMMGRLEKPRQKRRDDGSLKIVMLGYGEQSRRNRKDDAFKTEFPKPAGTAQKHRRKSKAHKFLWELELIAFRGDDATLLRIVSVDPAETAVEYRRKCGFGQYDDGSKPRKLPRLTTQDDPSLWKLAETLAMRISKLKTQNPPSLRQQLDEIDSEISRMEGEQSKGPLHYRADAKTSSLHCGYNDAMYAAALGVRISRLEESQRITYDFEQEVKVDERFICPDKGCKVGYHDAHRLNEHWRSGHPSAASIVTGSVCYPCNHSFEKSRQLILHEKAEHGDEYDSRLECYVRYFKQSLSSQDFIDLLHPVPEIPPSISDQVDNLDLYNVNGAFDDPNFVLGTAPLGQGEKTYHTYNQTGAVSSTNNQIDNFDLYDMNGVFDDPAFAPMFEAIDVIDETHPTSQQDEEPSSMNNQTDNLDLYDMKGVFDDPAFAPIPESAGQVDETHPTSQQDEEPSSMNNQIDNLDLYDMKGVFDDPAFAPIPESAGQVDETLPTCQQDGETILRSTGSAVTRSVTDGQVNDTELDIWSENP